MNTLPPAVLITSGPTREYLDPVRFLSNASSGKMGAALAEAVLEEGFRVFVVSGPVTIEYPSAAIVRFVETTEQMLDACLELFPLCMGVVSAAAPCDYRPVRYSQTKLSKTDDGLSVAFQSTPDILAALGRQKRPDQWSVGFALETDCGRERAQAKLRRKNCDFICLNQPCAINADVSTIEILNQDSSLGHFTASKKDLARVIIDAACRLKNNWVLPVN